MIMLINLVFNNFINFIFSPLPFLYLYIFSTYTVLPESVLATEAEGKKKYVSQYSEKSKSLGQFFREINKYNKFWKEIISILNLENIIFNIPQTTKLFSRVIKK